MNQLDDGIGDALVLGPWNKVSATLRPLWPIYTFVVVDTSVQEARHHDSGLIKVRSIGAIMSTMTNTALTGATYDIDGGQQFVVA